ncbi:MAG TPA: hemolysin family protein [Acidimicrobiales bacterium]|nr:hemolysin family protein [Acidimicrobiales bacterium]
MRRRRQHRPPPGARHPRFWRKDDGSAGPGQGAPENDGSTGEQERLILEALADLRDMDVREVMTPRVDVVPLIIPVHADDVARAVRESGHSCFPVVNDDLDDLVGVLFVNDLFRTGRPSGPESASEPTPLDISRRVRPAYVVPESLGILEALAGMRRQRRAFAVVVDEYGGVAGVLTVKDLIEPLVGDLRDEFDEEEEATIVRVDRSRWLLDGRASVDEVRERLGVELPDGEYLTLGGLLFDGFGHIPEEGETLPVGEWELKVVEMDKRRVAKVVARHDPEPGPDGTNGAVTSGAESRSEPAVEPGTGGTGTGGDSG